MKDPRISLKSPYLAAFLAFLFPGAGHWYQGRRFKATLFSACILSIFVWGMLLGNLQPVYSQIAHATRGHTVQMEQGRPTAKVTFGFYAQFLVGGLTLPAVIQQERFRGDNGLVDRLEEPLESEFIGVVRERGDEKGPLARKVRGQISLSPANQRGSQLVTGLLKGKFDDGTDVELHIGGPISLGRKVFGSPRREILCSIIEMEGSNRVIGTLDGTIHRGFLNWFQAPRDNAELDRLHGELSRTFDLASVFTWIAGLLNLMVIWDALDGPAYGYGDEKSEEDEDAEKDKNTSKDKPSKDPPNSGQATAELLPNS